MKLAIQFNQLWFSLFSLIINSLQLNLTLFWCLKIIWKDHSRIILENTNIFIFLISTISTLLKYQTLNNKIKKYICELYLLKIQIMNDTNKKFFSFPDCDPYAEKDPKQNLSKIKIIVNFVLIILKTMI